MNMYNLCQGPDIDNWYTISNFCVRLVTFYLWINK